jgi:MFS family permease
VPRFSVTRSLAPAAVERLFAPRDDVVGERLDPGPADRGASAGSGEPESGNGPVRRRRFAMADGPFVAYSRVVEVVASPDGRGPGRAGTGDGGDSGESGDSGDEGDVTVRQSFDFRLPGGTWRFLLNPAARSALRRPPASGRMPWWYPPERPDARAAAALGLLATLTLAVGYMGTLLTQTMTFAADEFEVGTGAQGNAFAAVRIGGLLAIALGALADRRGRRRVLTLALLTSIGATAAGALAPSLAVLTATQTVNRGAWAASGVLIAIIAAEEMPAGARAYALSLLALTGALGAGAALWLLPIADLGTRSWRLLYLVPLLFLPVLARIRSRIPEGRRYEQPHRNVRLTGHYGRLLLLGSTAFLLNVFGAPQSQFRNEFLRDERGMTAAAVAVFALVTGTPATLGVVVGGRLADIRGRRIVAATAVVVGTVLTALSFGIRGPGMWLSAIIGGIFTAALVPTITVYSPELFPTSLRGRASGIISTVAMAGSVVGLSAAGHLRDALGSFGLTLGILALAPLATVVLILGWFPETARRELEDLNPEDRGDPTSRSAVSIPP